MYITCLCKMFCCMLPHVCAGCFTVLHVCAGCSYFGFKHVCAEYFTVYCNKSVPDVLETVTKLECTFEVVFKKCLCV